MPFLNQCEEKFKNGEKVSQNDLEIEVHEYQDGKENTAKHIDAKIVLYVNKEKIVLHCYNSTQKVMVAGSKSFEFTNKFMEPFFTKEIVKSKEAIAEYDKSVKTSLCNRPKRVTSRSVKSIRSVINQSLFQCTKCAFSTKSHGTQIHNT